MYIDEDSWWTVLYDGWDGQGQLWRFTLPLPLLVMDLPAVVPVTQFVHNLQTGAICATVVTNEMPAQFQVIPPRPDSFFTPDALAGTGVR
jgi:hypothetical protein